MATLKPTTPLLTPNKGPLKPPSPLHPKTALKTPISHPQRRWRFQSHTSTSEQRRWRFQTTGPPGRHGLTAGPWAAARPGWASHSNQASLAWRAPEGTGGPGCGARGRWRGLAGLRDRPLRAEGSRVAISRAGRRPRAHKAARPWPQVARRPYGALHKGDACSVRCRGPVYLPTRPTHKRSRDRFPGHGLVNE